MLYISHTDLKTEVEKEHIYCGSSSRGVFEQGLFKKITFVIKIWNEVL
jgi:hypothetical protein